MSKAKLFKDGNEWIVLVNGMRMRCNKYETAAHHLLTELEHPELSFGKFVNPAKELACFMKS